MKPCVIESWQTDSHAAYGVGGLRMGLLKLATAVWIAWSLLASSAAHGQDPNGATAQSPLQERLKKKISVEFRKTPIEDVIRIIAEQADVDIVTSPNIKGETTVKLTDVPLQEALRSILDVHGFDFVIGENIIRVLTREEMPKVPERQITQVFEITYADVAEVVKSLEKFKSDVGFVSHVEGTSHILVTDKEAKVKDMGEFIRQVDRMTPQILVVARIYDVTARTGSTWASSGPRHPHDL
jgi:type II secretory pathway component HofQ